jgi:hypothetical protein
MSIRSITSTTLACLVVAACGGGGDAIPGDLMEDAAASDAVVDESGCETGRLGCECFPNHTCFPGLLCLGSICSVAPQDTEEADPPGPDVTDASDEGGEAPGDVAPGDTVPEEGVDPCAATCAGHCGAFGGCECGGCPEGKKCEGGLCIEDCTVAKDPPDDTFTDSNCDGIDGVIAKAVFVAPPQHGGDDFNPGTPDLPKATIQAAIDTAKTAGSGKDYVLVSAATYTGAITMADGVSIHGGYHKPMGWKRSTEYVATILVDASDANGDRVGVTAHGITKDTRLDRVTIQIADNTSPGGTSYGIHVADAAGMVIKHVAIVVGKAGDGAPGAKAGENATVSGIQGGWGTHACENNHQDSRCDSCGLPPAGSGAAATTCAIGGASGAGGSGGVGGKYYLDAGIDGGDGQGAGGVGGAGGTGGAGSTYAGGNTCNYAQAGAKGPDGSTGLDGTAGPEFGKLADGYYRRADAGPTGDGASGSGGGGGGGGFGCQWKEGTVFTYTCDVSGGGGGGGGSGGCAGGKGESGMGGGGAFGVLFVDTYPELTDLTTSVAGGGKGGDGTAGGAGKPGGPGGSGGDYYSSSIDCSHAGDGGDGGAGGRGGHGGGGGGGPAWCYYFFTPTTTPDTGIVKDAGCTGASGTGAPLAGKGGSSSANPGADGTAGTMTFCGTECAAQSP